MRLLTLVSLALACLAGGRAATISSWADVHFYHRGYIAGDSTNDSPNVAYASLDSYGWSDVYGIGHNWGAAQGWTDPYGQLHAYAAGENWSSVAETDADAQANYYADVTFSGPGSTPISVSLNLFTSGSQFTTGSGSNYAAVEFYGDIGSYTFSYRTCSFNAAPLFCGIPVPLGNTTTASFTVTPGTVVSIALHLHASYQATGNIASVGAGSVRFEDTAGLPTTGPIFNLPAGYTVNSDDGFIVNNQLNAPTGAAVPEPGLTLPVCLVLIAIPLWNRRRSAPPHPRAAGDQ